MRVDVHGDADLAVPQPLHERPRRDPAREEQAGTGVTQIVEPLRPQLRVLQQLLQVAVDARPSSGASRTSSGTHDARTRIAIDVPAAYGPGWVSPRPLK